MGWTGSAMEPGTGSKMCFPERPRSGTGEEISVGFGRDLQKSEIQPQSDDPGVSTTLKKVLEFPNKINCTEPLGI